MYVTKNMRNAIERYKQLRGIGTDTQLLADIGKMMGKKGSEACDFAATEKSNFSQALNGKRPLKDEFIVPIEKVLGVSLAKLVDENAYKLPSEKGDVPFDKGFRYYAYLDDPNLYKNEFDCLLAKDGKSILNQTDEFEKTFLDYVVEYHSVNGVKYLHDEYGIKIKYPDNQFVFRKESGSIWITFENQIEFARLVADMNDAELFNDIFDSYNMVLTWGDYDFPNAIFDREEYWQIILDNDGLFRSLFEKRSYEYALAGSRVRREKKAESITCHLINPIINNCLRYALNHPDGYRQRAIDLLTFGIRHNNEILSRAGDRTYVICNKLGGVIDSERKNYFLCDIEDIAVCVDADTEVNDDEIKALIEQLPKFASEC